MFILFDIFMSFHLTEFLLLLKKLEIDWTTVKSFYFSGEKMFLLLLLYNPSPQFYTRFMAK